APPGVNGGVVKTITGSFVNNTATGVWAAGDAEPLTAARIARYLTGDLYMNVHTSMFGNGEIRGQLRSPDVVGIGEAASAPVRTALEQNVPNPFNPSTVIRYTLARREHVSLRIYDAQGREVYSVLDEEQAAGPNQVTLDARGLASGVYFYRLETPSFSDSRKLVLTR
ncbi:MAG TPA: CHRD domain-containing protein, partial [Candidatus Udaeobacter sp.]|nr:CHRD domain-containing protein [Candidatus Udaeobacter sp.]